MKMKTNRIAILTAVTLTGILLTALAAFAQAPATGQWDIVASKETAENTVDNTPLQFITDWTTTTSNNTTTVNPVVANTFTNSSCSALGGVANLTVAYNSSSKIATVVVTLDYGQQVTFTSSQTTGSSEFTGTFTTSSGGCTNGDSGNFTAKLYQPLSGTMTGTIESYMQTNTVDVTVQLSVASNFNVTGSFTATNKTCMANLTINGTAAQAYGPSIATGDVLIVYASDTTGDVVGFIFSATNADGEMLSPPWPQTAYVTYMVLAGPCSGNGGTDAPFHQVEDLTPHVPIYPRTPIRPRTSSWRSAFSATPPAESLPSEGERE
jgi:hypothetical protein